MMHVGYLRECIEQPTVFSRVGGVNDDVPAGHFVVAVLRWFGEKHPLVGVLRLDLGHRHIRSVHRAPPTASITRTNVEVKHASGHAICTSAGCSTNSSAPSGGVASFNSFTRQPGWLIEPENGGSPVTLPTTRIADGSNPFCTVTLSSSAPGSTCSITACCFSAACA